MSTRCWCRIGVLVCAVLSAACATTGKRAEGEGKSTSPAAVPQPDAAVLSPEGTSKEGARLTVGTPAPEFTGTATTGEAVRLSQFRGKKAVLLQFWGIRCSPCVAEMSFLSDLQREYGEGLQVLGVNADRLSVDGVRRALQSHRVEVDYPMLADQDFAICQNYTQWLIPLTVFVDRDQTIRGIHTGFSDAMKGDLRAEARRLVGGAP